jgi:nucleoside-diphosphate-sugar epimerase
VRDLVRVIKLSLEHQTEGALNVASGNAASFHKIAQQAMQLASVEGNLECLPRSSPITHKHFDNALLQRAFPGFEFTPLQAGLKEASQELLGAD